MNRTAGQDSVPVHGRRSPGPRRVKITDTRRGSGHHRGKSDRSAGTLHRKVRCQAALPCPLGVCHDRLWPTAKCQLAKISGAATRPEVDPRAHVPPSRRPVYLPGLVGTSWPSCQYGTPRVLLKRMVCAAEIPVGHPPGSLRLRKIARGNFVAPNGRKREQITPARHGRSALRLRSPEKDATGQAMTRTGQLPGGGRGGRAACPQMARRRSGAAAPEAGGKAEGSSAGGVRPGRTPEGENRPCRQARSVARSNG